MRLPLPDRAEVTGRRYEPWGRERIVVDTSGTPEDSLAALASTLDVTS
ncbi:hypothetical protein [Streptomyces sp. NPDC001492]